MNIGNDTARRDWLILIIGLLAGGWFFFDFGFHHPLSIADASLGKQSAESLGADRINSLGYPQSDVTYLAAFTTDSELVESIQRQTDFHNFYNQNHGSDAYPFNKWRVDIVAAGGRQTANVNDFEFEQRDFQDAVSMTVTFDEIGQWLEFRNPGNLRPHRLLAAESLRRAIDLPDDLQFNARIDSVALATFVFDLERSTSGSFENRTGDIIQIGMEQAQRMAEFYLEQSGWPLDLMQFESGRVIPFDSFEAAEMVYTYADSEVTDELQLTLRLAPAGALLSMSSAYVNMQPGTDSFVINSLRILFIIIFAFWAVILLYIRVRLRVIDINSAILFAVLAGLAVPLFMFLQWLHEQAKIPGSPGAIDIVWLLSIVGLSAAFVSLIFFTITVIGESVTRQYWQDKIRTLDLIRIGHFFNLPVGTVFIHSVSFGLILAAAWSAVYWLFPGSYISVNNSFFSDTIYFAPVVRIFSILFICFITVQAVFLVLAGQISGMAKNKLLIVLSTTAVFAIIIPVNVDTGPVWMAMIMNGIIGLGLSLIYIFRDFLTTALTYYIFTLLIMTADGWLMVQSPDAMIFYPSAGLIILFLAFGFVAVTRGKSVKELPKYVPEYIEDLAQEERIKQELQIARKVQQSFLPVRKPELETIDLAAVCIPAYETGGDYYDFIDLEDNKLAITVGDVSGKGFQAAFYMTFIKGILHALCQDYQSTVSVLKRANKLFRKNARKGTFISLIYGVIDQDKQEFKFSRAGHNPLLNYVKKENVIKIMKPNGLALGMTDGYLFESNINESTIQLKKGDMLILFTDGIVEAVNNNGEQYGDHRLQKMIYFHHAESAEEIVKNVINDVNKFAGGANQHDDMTLLVIKQK